MSIADSWARIEHALRSRAGGDFKPLPLGASRDDIRQVESELGTNLPDAFRESYALHNGSGGRWACEQGFLMPLIAPSEGPLVGYGILDLWRAMRDVAEAMSNERSSPTGPIRNAWWDQMWVPLTENECGDFVCLDLAPAPGGKRGQIIDWNHEQGATRVLAAGFGEWLAILAAPDAVPNPGA